MDHLQQSANSPPLARTAIGLELCAVIGLFALFLAISTLLQNVILHFFLLFLFLILLTWRLHRTGRSWHEYGLAQPASLIRVALRTLAMLLVVNVGVNLAALPLIERLLGNRPDLSPFAQISGDTGQLFFWLFFVWTWAAFGEEMFFRGYLITRIAELFPSSKLAWWWGLLLSSALFGASHLYQGLAGLVVMFIIGMAAGCAYLLWGRNLWVPILWHGLTDSLSIYAIYRGWLQL